LLHQAEAISPLLGIFFRLDERIVVIWHVVHRFLCPGIACDIIKIQPVRPADIAMHIIIVYMLSVNKSDLTLDGVSIIGNNAIWEIVSVYQYTAQ
jgi:hypothetical protein